jgi:hypothetical protein
VELGGCPDRLWSRLRHRRDASTRRVVELAIGESRVLDEPLSEYTVSKMRDDPEKYAAILNFPEDHIEVKE